MLQQTPVDIAVTALTSIVFRLVVATFEYSQVNIIHLVTEKERRLYIQIRLLRPEMGSITRSTQYQTVTDYLPEKGLLRGLRMAH